ncbi:MAG: hypothetical protein G01um101419_24 [Parcubacteria group bacterium Gr01-1014_19]|nr:MAG: hypothetical protein G01um101419_24 [Parcubacteria group bacterium Gr01-1014_19]
MHRIALTGGPCGGKSTSINYLKEKLADLGFSAIFVPEVASRIIGAGLDPRFMSPEQFDPFEELLLDTQIADEENYKRALVIKSTRAKDSVPENKRIIVCDRGCPDIKAYMEENAFYQMLRRKKLTMSDIRDLRYDAVIHLMTAAKGKEEYYTLENNPSRLESDPAKAREADDKTLAAWDGHSHKVIIDNSTLFDGKLKRVLQVVQKIVGIPVSLEIERKFLLDGTTLPWIPPVSHQKIQIEQIYIADGSAGESRIRRRSQDNEGSVYYETFKQPTESPMKRIETEQQIDAVTYNRKVKNANPNCDVIRKNRYCFSHVNKYFELDIFTEPERLRGLALLEIELTEESEEIGDMPAWLGKVTEVTGDPRYSNFALALRK